MRPFAEMSLPDLEITREGYKEVKENTHTKIQQLDKEGAAESLLQEATNKFTRTDHLLNVIEAEIFNQKQDK